MLVITDFRIIFITKTSMAYRHHDAYSLLQLKRFQDGRFEFQPIDRYSLRDLETDLFENPENIKIPFSNVIGIEQEKKRWGTRLKVITKLNGSNKSKTYKFSIAKGWVKYPLKDRVQFQHVDWAPIIRMVKKYNNNNS